MNKIIIIPFAVFVAMFWLEEIFPHVEQKVSRSMHGLNNIALSFCGGIVNLVFLILMIPLIKGWGLERHFGLLNKLALPWPVSVALTFLLFDFWMYVWHRANHQIGFLWQLHRTHHNDTDMDSTTALRYHPLELLISSFLNISVVFFFGLDLGQLLVYNLVFQSMVFFGHSNVALPERYDRLLRRIVVTPHMHRIHHSIDETQINTNFSSVFSFWDRVLRSFKDKENVEPIVYGLLYFRQKRWQDVGGALLIPFADEKSTLEQ